MHIVIGIVVGLSAIFAYSATGWMYSGETVIADIDEKLVEYNFDVFNQKAVRKEIKECLRDSYQYLSMSMYFDRADVSLPGFHKMFQQFSEREMKNAMKLMNYMNLREGNLKLDEIPEPYVDRWADGETALWRALKMEKKALIKFRTIQQMAGEKNDPHLKHFIEENFMNQKVEVIKDLGDKITKLKRYRYEDAGLGLQMFDSYLL